MKDLSILVDPVLDKKTYWNNHEERHGNEGLIDFEKEQEFCGITSIDLYWF